MSKHYSLTTLFLFAMLSGFATDHTIVTAGFAYSPAVLSAAIGDNVTIVASSNHPTTEVSEATWNANGTTPLTGGFGSHTTSFTFTIEAAGTIFYVCDNHVASQGMKGQINVSSVGIEEYSDQISVDFGTMPIVDGMLSYTIEAPENLVRTISVVSVTGQQVLESTIESTEGSLELNNRPGMYIVLLKDENGKLVYREAISLR